MGRGRDDLHKVAPQASAVARQGAREGTGWKGDTPGLVHTMGRFSMVGDQPEQL